MTHRYTLEPYKTPASRYTCPQCNQPKTFTRYIDTLTDNAHLGDHVGKCDRESNCGYHFTPKQFLDAIPTLHQERRIIRRHEQFSSPSKLRQLNLKPPLALKPGTISKKLFEKTLSHYERNDFVEYLVGLFDNETLNRLIEDYHIGTAKHWPHATIFWQVDRKNDVRTGKIMLYDPYTGKRVKQPYAHITWVHKLVEQPDFNLKQCFFGEHLIYPGDKKPIAIVESEKTAIIAAGFMPDYVWIAAGSLEGLNADKCRVLHGRDVMLFPDADAYPKWEEKMRKLQIKMPGTRFAISNYLKDASPDYRQQGLDLADWLIIVEKQKVLPEAQQQTQLTE
ncbi:MAG: DUF6371 domain-containing protein [Bacteroidota bacterium]